jgi:hypothetical protein
LRTRRARPLPSCLAVFAPLHRLPPRRPAAAARCIQPYMKAEDRHTDSGKHDSSCASLERGLYSQSSARPAITAVAVPAAAAPVTAAACSGIDRCHSRALVPSGCASGTLFDTRPRRAARPLTAWRRGWILRRASRADRGCVPPLPSRAARAAGL